MTDDLLRKRYVSWLLYQAVAGEHGVGAVGPDGGDEVRVGQRGRRSSVTLQLVIQQDLPARDHQRNFWKSKSAAV